MIDNKALFNIGYGLYIITSNDAKKHNGLIVNSVMQLTSDPNRVAVCINKSNYSCKVIAESKKMNVNCLNTNASFALFKQFGFQSGKDVDKFAEYPYYLSSNGLAVLEDSINSYLSLEVEQTIEFETHVLFICLVKQAVCINDVETMTYNYYQQNVKPKPQITKKNVWVCKVCGYVYEGEELPADFICPICKHPASDFELIEK